MKYTIHLLGARCCIGIGNAQEKYGWMAIFGLRWNWIISCILNWTKPNWTEMNCTLARDTPYGCITEIESQPPSFGPYLLMLKYANVACGSLWKIIFCGKLFLRKFINCIIMNGAVVMIVCLFVWLFVLRCAERSCALGCVCPVTETVNRIATRQFEQIVLQQIKWHFCYYCWNGWNNNGRSNG